jgi:aminoacyl tRNA synthase complex-interacting multifunctional protein 1
MVLCASNQDHTQVEFVVPPNDAKIGERVMFDGYNGQPEPENKVAKKKILESVLPHLMTNDDGVVTWKGAISFTTAGPCVSSKGMKNAKVA